MTYVVTETCIKCKYTDCVDVCPVDCFREGPNMLVIDPDECIDCTLCVAECPVEAIFAEDDVPDAQREFTQMNAELAKVWKPIIEKKAAPADADEWAQVKEKRQLIEKVRRCGRRSSASAMWAEARFRNPTSTRIPACLPECCARGACLRPLFRESGRSARSVRAVNDCQARGSRRSRSARRSPSASRLRTSA